MLAMGKVVEVERLLAEGKLSQRKISLRVGVSRGVISAIARGTRPDYETRRQNHGDDPEPRGEVGRCPTCGGRVYMPCRLCQVRQLQVDESDVLPKLRRRSRQQGVRRLLVAVLRAAGESQRSAVQSPEALSAREPRPDETPPKAGSSPHGVTG